MLDVDDRLLLRFDTAITRYAPTTGASADLVAQFLFGGIWDVKDHWSVGGDLELSPPSTQHAQVPLVYAPTVGVTAPKRGKVTTTNVAYGLSLSADYDSATDDDDDAHSPPDFEHAVSLSGGFTEYRTSERLASANFEDGNLLTRQSAANYCATTACPSGFLQSFDKTSASVGQLMASLSFTETLYRATVASLTGTVYDYLSLPTQTYSFGLAQRALSSGDAVPIVPLRWSVRPDVSRDFGDFRASLFAQYGQYVQGSGHNALAGVKLHYKFSASAKAWILANFQRDTENAGNQFSTFVAGAGVRLWF